MKLIVRNVHKYLSFFISVQLLLWTVSGIYFAFNKIELVRGEQYRLTNFSDINLGEIEFDIPKTSNLEIKKRLDGTPLDKISGEMAMLLVQQNTTLTPIEAEEITSSKKGSEYRGRTLPLMKVISKNEKDKLINVYLNVYSGEVTAIRSMQWKIWDLMWGFHIMDWQERDNIDNLFLKIFSILALVSSISGILLFFKVDMKK
jgi:uncharacterized iron-regulated membrane protein